MESRSDKKRVVCAPIVPYFIAAATGILIDATTEPGYVFWAFFFGLSVAIVVCDWAFSWRKRLGDALASPGETPKEPGDAENPASPEVGRRETSDVESVFGANLKKTVDFDVEGVGWNEALRRHLSKNRDAGRLETERVPMKLAEERRDDEAFQGFANLDFEGFSLVPPFTKESFFEKNDGNRGLGANVERDGEAFQKGFDSFGSAGLPLKNAFDAPPLSRFFRGTRELGREFLGKARRLVVALSADLARRGVKTLRNRDVWRCAAALTAVAALAGWRHFIYFNVFPPDEIAFAVPASGTPATLELRLVATPILYRSEKPSNPLFDNLERTSFVATAIRVKNGGVWKEYSGKIAVSVSGDATFLKIGDEIRVTGRLAPPEKVGNPWERDRRFSLRARRILTTLSVESVESVERLPTPKFSVAFWAARKLETCRRAVAATFRRELSSRNAAVAAGMTLGFRNEIDETTNEAFLKTGTIHLLSISGLHIALIICVFRRALRIFGVSERWTAFAALGLIAFYLGLTDMRTPVLRAGIFTAVLSCAVLLRRRATSLNSLAATALALLFWNPCELFQLGAQLSFLATGVFLWSNRASLLDRAEAATTRRQAVLERRRAMERRDQFDKINARDRSDQTVQIAKSETRSAADSIPESGGSRFCRSVCSTTRRLGRLVGAKYWGAARTGSVIWSVGTPLILRTANLFTPIAIAANVFIWLPATLALILALFLGALGAATTAFGWTNGTNVAVESDFVETTSKNGGGSFVADCADGAISLGAAATDAMFSIFLGTLDALSRPKFGAFRLPELGDWALWTFYSPLIFWTLFPSRRPSRRTLARCLAIWLAAVLVIDAAGSWNAKRRDLFRADVFSVGHGIAIFLQFFDGRTALVDCGSISSAKRVADLVEKNLWNAGKNRIDALILSHADYDHYSGIEELDESIEIGRVFVSPAMFLKENPELIALQTGLGRRGVSIETVAGGETLARFGFPEIAILHPTPGRDGTFGAESNENSLVVAVERRGRLLMFPGDLDATDPDFLTAEPTRFDLILAPHHGGKSESYRGLLNWARPTWIVVSGGSFQRNFETESNLRDEGFRVLHTLDDGCVRIEIERDFSKGAKDDALGKMKIQTFRSERAFESGDF